MDRCDIDSHILHAENEIRSQPCPRCYLCGELGQFLYEGLADRLFGAPGKWNVKRCPCPECGLLWLDPMPIEDDIGMAYEKYYTHHNEMQLRSLPRSIYESIRKGYLRRELHYTKGVGRPWFRYLAPIAYLLSRSELEAGVMCLAAPTPTGRLLDVGCGNGHFLSRMQDMGWEVEGIDTDPYAVEAARSKCLTVRLGNFESKYYPANHYDALCASHVIEHVHDPERLLQACHRVLKPGGRLAVVTPNAASWGHKHYGKDWRGLEPPRHLRLFSPKNIRRIVEAAEFELERIATLRRSTWFIYRASEMLWRMRSPWEKRKRHVSLIRDIQALLSHILGRTALSPLLPAGEEIIVVAKKRREQGR